MKKLESLWYEVSPYIYGISGIITILSASKTGNFIGVLSGILLLTAGATVVGMRFSYRGHHNIPTHKK
ncbi:MAG: hypothetical protein Q7U57_02715 [Methylovulum sp.]|nr:hypothetical protein [Methylovulum sp.]